MSTCPWNADRVRASLRHGAAFALLILTATSTAHASRSCLDQADLGASQMLLQDNAGCWAYGSHLPRTEAPSAIREMMIVTEEPGLGHPLPDVPFDDEAFATMSQLVMFVAVVLATASGFAVCRSDNSIRYQRAPIRKSW